MTPMDMLEDIFERQTALNKRIGVDTASLDEAGRQQWLLNYCRAMSQEVAELIDCVPWKWWAKYQTFDVQNAQVEIVDLLHFLISAAQVLGLSAREVHDLYCQKHRVNVQRQKNGYTKKDESDNKGIGL